MKLSEAKTILRAQLRAERAVSAELGDIPYFDWKRVELDKLINELENVSTLESYKTFIGHRDFFNNVKLEFGRKFSYDVDEIETKKLNEMISKEEDIDIINYLYYSGSSKTWREDKNLCNNNEKRGNDSYTDIDRKTDDYCVSAKEQIDAMMAEMREESGRRR